MDKRSPLIVVTGGFSLAAGVKTSKGGGRATMGDAGIRPRRSGNS